MEHDLGPLGACSWTALACLLVLLAAGWAPAADAQIGPYTVEGQVLDPDGEPVQDAEVELTPANGSEPTQTTRSDEEGTYRFRNVEEGRWDLTAQHPCCGPAYRNVTVSGTQLVHEVDLELSREGSTGGEDTVLLRGRTVEKGTDEPAPEVRLTVENRYEGPDGEHGQARVEVRSNANGTYVLELRPGWVSLEARGDGYDVTRAGFALEEDREVDVPMRPTEHAAVELSGRLLAPNGTAVPDGHVRVEPDRSGDCDADACAQPIRDDGHERVERDGVGFTIRSAADPYASTRADEDGTWRLTTREGAIRVTARAPEHLPARRSLDAAAGEEHSVNLTLTPIPPDSVTLDGRVEDAASGDPVPGATIRVENQAWGDHAWARTDANGTFTLSTKPGYTIVTVEADDPHETVCAPHAERAVSTSSEAGEDHEGARESSSSPPGSIEPEPACRSVEREHAYRPQALTLVPEAEETRNLDVALEPRPAPSATLEGWIVNASSQEGIGNATLSLVNEDSGARGRAEADADGSFTVDVTPGYYTVRARAEGHYDAVQNVHVPRDETQRIAVEMTPGEPRHRSCCIVYAAHPEATAANATDAGGSTGSDGTSSGPTTRATATDGAEADAPSSRFEGGPGGLGPYQPGAERTDSPGDESAAPGPGLLAALLALLVAGILRRR